MSISILDIRVAEDHTCGQEKMLFSVRGAL